MSDTAPQFLKPIPGYRNYLVTEYGKVWSKISQKFLLPGQDRAGYLRCNLTGSQCYAHRLVALAWLPNPDNLPVVHHKDGDILNNHYSNLEWCTQQHNVRQGATRKLSDEDVKEIKRLYATGDYTQYEIADMFRVDQSTVSLLTRG